MPKKITLVKIGQSILRLEHVSAIIQKQNHTEVHCGQTIILLTQKAPVVIAMLFGDDAVVREEA